MQHSSYGFASQPMEGCRRKKTHAHYCSHTYYTEYHFGFSLC